MFFSIPGDFRRRRYPPLGYPPLEISDAGDIWTLALVLLYPRSSKPLEPSKLVLGPFIESLRVLFRDWQKTTPKKNDFGAQKLEVRKTKKEVEGSKVRAFFAIS